MIAHQTWVTQIEDELDDDRSLADQSRMLMRFVKKIQADALEHASTLCWAANDEILIRKAASEVTDPE